MIRFDLEVQAVSNQVIAEMVEPHEEFQIALQEISKGGMANNNRHSISGRREIGQFLNRRDKVMLLAWREGRLGG